MINERNTVFFFYPECGIPTERHFQQGGYHRQAQHKEQGLPEDAVGAAYNPVVVQAETSGCQKQDGYGKRKSGTDQAEPVVFFFIGLKPFVFFFVVNTF